MRESYLPIMAKEWRACQERDDATSRRRLAGLRAWHRRPNLTLHQVYESGACIAAIEKWGRHKGLLWSTRESLRLDMPGWRIPGLSSYHQLVEYTMPTDLFWLVWPVILDGHVLECSALQGSFEGKQTWWIWHGTSGTTKSYLGIAHSLREARTKGTSTPLAP